MFNVVTFLITCAGCINWFCIGVFQFDYIAGIFGSQAHFVSRFFYVIIGICAIYMLLALTFTKGRLTIYTEKALQEEKSKKSKKISTK